MSDINKKVNPNDFKPFLYAQLPLFPLYKWDAIDEETGANIGKVPCVRWRDFTISKKQLKTTIAKNQNIGYRIRADHLIIDYDPRNDEVGDSLTRLISDFEVDENCPTVITGSGGVHLYLKKSADIKVRKTVKEAYPGIDFLSDGTYVVIPGSVHPNGTNYIWDDLCDTDLDKLPEAPQRLIELLDRSNQKQNTSKSHEYGEYTEDQLKNCLNLLDVSRYGGDHDGWLKMMMAAHHMTGGDGFEVFQEWSDGDGAYSNLEDIHRKRWYSLETKNGNVTAGSLFDTLKRLGKSWQEAVHIDAIDEFSEFADEDDYEDDDDDLSEILNQTKKAKYGKGMALEAVKSLTDDSDKLELGRVYNAMCSAPVKEMSKCLDEVTKRFGITESKLKQWGREAERCDLQLQEKLVEDIPEILAKIVLEKDFNDGDWIINHKDTLWSYTGTHWAELNGTDYLRGIVIRRLEKYRLELGAEVKSIASIASNAVTLLAGEVAVRTLERKMDLFGKPKPVINCTNGELWVDRKGKTKFRPHNPESWLLTSPSIEYNPKAKAKMFSKAMLDTFRVFDDRRDIIRHIEEVMGYIMQPHKDIPVIFMFKGPGGDGKSTLAKIIAGMCGEGNALVRSVVDLSRDPHGDYALLGKLVVIDDDLRTNAKLDEGWLKTVSESSQVDANPKGRDLVTFTNAACVVMCTNRFPYFSDLTEGLRRRMMVVPFEREFHRSKTMIRSFSDKILKLESSGILNLALAGLRRLRDRDNFKKPESCIFAEKDWLQEGNAFAAFVGEYLEDTVDTRRISGIELYAAYEDWIQQEHGKKNQLGKRGFYRSLTELGYKKIDGHNHTVYFKGLKLIAKLTEAQEEFDEFVDEDWING